MITYPLNTRVRIEPIVEILTTCTTELHRAMGLLCEASQAIPLCRADLAQKYETLRSVIRQLHAASAFTFTLEVGAPSERDLGAVHHTRQAIEVSELGHKLGANQSAIDSAIEDGMSPAAFVAEQAQKLSGHGGP